MSVSLLASEMSPELAKQPKAWMATKKPLMLITLLAFHSPARTFAAIGPKEATWDGSTWRLERGWGGVIGCGNPNEILYTGTLARHSDIRLTLGVYTHVELQDQTAAIEALGGPPESDSGVVSRKWSA